MRMRGIHSTVTISELAIHDPDIARLNPDQVYRPPVYVPFDPLTLAPGEQAALLSMHLDTHVRRAASAGLPRYAPSDFDALRERDLCDKSDGYRHHRLTGAGRIAAFTLEKALCIKLGVHVRRQSTAENHLNTVRCSCGWIGYAERNIHGSHGIEVSFGKHLREVRSQQAVNVIRTALKPMPKVEGA